VATARVAIASGPRRGHPPWTSALAVDVLASAHELRSRGVSAAEGADLPRRARHRSGTVLFLSPAPDLPGPRARAPVGSGVDHAAVRLSGGERAGFRTREAPALLIADAVPTGSAMSKGVAVQAAAVTARWRTEILSPAVRASPVRSSPCWARR